MILELESSANGSPQLNGFLGDLIGSVLAPKSSSNPSEVAQLESELYYKQQELEAQKKKQTLIVGVSALLGVSTLILGYKAFKK